VVGDHGEGVTVLSERLRERLTGVVEVVLVDESDARTDRLDHITPVDDRVADDVAIDREQLCRKGGEGPLVIAGGRVEPADQICERRVGVAGGEVGGVAVLDLLQRHHVGAERLDRRDDLGCLLLELGVGACSPPWLTAGEEVVEHVERTDLHIAANLVGDGRPGVLRRRCPLPSRRPAAAATGRTRSRAPPGR